jgi:hypothetical protein
VYVYAECWSVIRKAAVLWELDRATFNNIVMEGVWELLKLPVSIKCSTSVRALHFRAAS